MYSVSDKAVYQRGGTITSLQVETDKEDTMVVGVRAR